MFPKSEFDKIIVDLKNKNYRKLIDRISADRQRGSSDPRRTIIYAYALVQLKQLARAARVKLPARVEPAYAHLVRAVYVGVNRPRGLLALRPRDPMERMEAAVLNYDFGMCGEVARGLGEGGFHFLAFSVVAGIISRGRGSGSSRMSGSSGRWMSGSGRGVASRGVDGSGSGWMSSSDRGSSTRGSDSRVSSDIRGNDSRVSSDIRGRESSTRGDTRSGGSRVSSDTRSVRGDTRGVRDTYANTNTHANTYANNGKDVETVRRAVLAGTFSSNCLYFMKCHGILEDEIYEAVRAGKVERNLCYFLILKEFLLDGRDVLRFAEGVEECDVNDVSVKDSSLVNGVPVNDEGLVNDVPVNVSMSVPVNDVSMNVSVNVSVNDADQSPSMKRSVEFLLAELDDWDLYDYALQRNIALSERKTLNFLFYRLFRDRSVRAMRRLLPYVTGVDELERINGVVSVCSACSTCSCNRCSSCSSSSSRCSACNTCSACSACSGCNDKCSDDNRHVNVHDGDDDNRHDGHDDVNHIDNVHDVSPSFRAFFSRDIAAALHAFHTAPALISLKLLLSLLIASRQEPLIVLAFYLTHLHKDTPAYGYEVRLVHLFIARYFLYLPAVAAEMRGLRVQEVQRVNLGFLYNDVAVFYRGSDGDCSDGNDGNDGDCSDSDGKDGKDDCNDSKDDCSDNDDDDEYDGKDVYKAKHDGKDEYKAKHDGKDVYKANDKYDKSNKYNKYNKPNNTSMEGAEDLVMQNIRVINECLCTFIGAGRLDVAVSLLALKRKLEECTVGRELALGTVLCTETRNMFSGILGADCAYFFGKLTRRGNRAGNRARGNRTRNKGSSTNRTGGTNSTVSTNRTGSTGKTGSTVSTGSTTSTNTGTNTTTNTTTTTTTNTTTTTSGAGALKNIFNLKKSGESYSKLLENEYYDLRDDEEFEKLLGKISAFQENAEDF